MTIRILCCAALIAANGCVKRRYQPAGDPGPLNVAGIYAVTESVYSMTCAGMAARKERFRVEVEHPAGAATLKMTVDGLPFDAQIRPDGNFASTAQTIPRGRSLSSTTAVGGRFTDVGFSARITIKTVEGISPVRPGEPTTRVCDYQLRWQGEKM